MKTTTVNGFGNEPVIVTAGMRAASGRQIFGVFARAEDARSERADELALGIVGPERLTAEQIDDAKQNSEMLCD